MTGGSLTTFAAVLYDWLKFLHVLAAMVWLGGTIALSFVATRFARSGDGVTVARFVGSLSLVGPAVLAPATLSVVGFGVWLVVDSAAWDFGQTWVWLGLALFGAAFVVGAAFQSRFAIAARRAAEAGRSDEAARYLVRWAWGSRVIVVLLTVAACDMVIKPGL
jgi:uncharacterized membrane protein